jgi:hypothetical protein
MTRDEILRDIKKFFDVDELVCDHAVAAYKDRAWRILDTNYLHALLVIRRDILKRPMYCNSKTAHQRGYRCNMCQLVKSKKSIYVTPHGLGKAGDFTVVGMTAQQARELIKQNAHLLPCKVRLERWDSTGVEISWLHLDTIDEPQNPKVYEFHA